jgi:hypothetical protein
VGAHPTPATLELGIDRGLFGWLFLLEALPGPTYLQGELMGKCRFKEFQQLTSVQMCDFKLCVEWVMGKAENWRGRGVGAESRGFQVTASLACHSPPSPQPPAWRN